MMLTNQTRFWLMNNTYKGNRYTIIGTFNTEKDDGLVNNIFNEIGVIGQIV